MYGFKQLITRYKTLIERKNYSIFKNNILTLVTISKGISKRRNLLAKIS